MVQNPKKREGRRFAKRHLPLLIAVEKYVERGEGKKEGKEKEKEEEEEDERSNSGGRNKEEQLQQRSSCISTTNHKFSPTLLL